MTHIVIDIGPNIMFALGAVAVLWFIFRSDK